MVELRQDRYKTRPAYEGGKEPKWNMHVDINVKYIGDDIRLRIMNKGGCCASDTCIGQAIIKSSSLCVPQGIDDWWTLQLKDEPAGQIHFKATWEPNGGMGMPTHPQINSGPNPMAQIQNSSAQQQAMPKQQAAESVKRSELNFGDYEFSIVKDN